MRLLYILFFLSFGILSQAQMEITIEQARENDADGVPVLDGEEVVVEGKALGPNFRPEGLTFIIMDANSGRGINIFSLEGDLGYSITDYENIRVTGILTHFRGLAQIEASSIEVVGGGGFNPSIKIVTQLDEISESYLVVIKDVSLADPSQWVEDPDPTSSGYNVTLTNGTNEFDMRIDADTDIFGMAAPQGTFDVTGIGGQFDRDAPHDEGYQIIPRGTGDIDPYDTEVMTSQYTFYTMPDLRENDADGVPVLEDELVEATGIVHGTNFRPGGLQFTIIDEFNVGVGVFADENFFGYEVNQGDLIGVNGTLVHFNGLTQINPDSIWVISTDNQLVAPRMVTQLDESTESSFVMVAEWNVPDPSQWLGNGMSFNINIEDQAGTNFLVRIDGDTYWADQSFPGGGNIYQGIGGQYDETAAFDEGYQLLPSFQEDIYPFLSTYDLYEGTLEVYPNPATTLMNIRTEEDIKSITILDLTGKAVLSNHGNGAIDVSQLAAGAYLLQVSTSKGNLFKRIYRQ